MGRRLSPRWVYALEVNRKGLEAEHRAEARRGDGAFCVPLTHHLTKRGQADQLVARHSAKGLQKGLRGIVGVKNSSANTPIHEGKHGRADWIRTSDLLTPSQIYHAVGDALGRYFLSKLASLRPPLPREVASIGCISVVGVVRFEQEGPDERQLVEAHANGKLSSDDVSQRITPPGPHR